MKGNKKSIQASIFILLLGVVLPKLLEVIGVNTINNFFIKRTIALSFSISTFIVGILYSIGLIRGKIEGGKARIVICLIISIVLSALLNSIISYLVQIKDTIIIITSIIGLLFMLLLLLWYILRLNNIQSSYKESCEVKNQEQKVNTNELEENNFETTNNQAIGTNDIEDNQSELFTIFELWNRKLDSENV